MEIPRDHLVDSEISESWQNAHVIPSFHLFERIFCDIRMAQIPNLSEIKVHSKSRANSGGHIVKYDRV